MRCGAHQGWVAGRVRGDYAMTILRLLPSVLALSSGALFGSNEKSDILQYWNQPGRYAITPAECGWVARTTPESSQWLAALDKARGLTKGARPNRLPAGTDAWVTARIAHDKAMALQEAADRNSGQQNSESLEDPGPTPAALSNLAGEAPKFYAAVLPQKYSVRFDDAETFYIDQPEMNPRSPSFRFPQGVRAPGTPLKQLTSKALFDIYSQAGLTPSEGRVFAAVSGLEGGFDAINTYDTGVVSVGFIQFACREKGAGSLGQVLLDEKQNDTEAFGQDFRRFGIDVDDSGNLVALDLTNGAELSGGEAALKIVDDKRLVAVFHRAGSLSTAFRAAQIRTAKRLYMPSDDIVTARFNGQPTKVRVGDFVRSEAGMAILMDRKVHIGNIRNLASVVATIIERTGAQSVEDLAAHEEEIVKPMVNRKNYLDDPSLTQPTQGADQRIARKHRR